MKALTGFCQQVPIIQFSPANDTVLHHTEEYKQVWNRYGKQIIKELQLRTGLRFLDSSLTILIIEDVSNSGRRRTGMQLRASYSYDDKKGYLVHELGHRLHLSLSMSRNYDDHPLLFYYLYDTWVKLYGRKFAKKQVLRESARKGIYDYETTWKNVMTLSKIQRKKKLKAEIARLGLYVPPSRDIQSN